MAICAFAIATPAVAFAYSPITSPNDWREVNISEVKLILEDSFNSWQDVLSFKNVKAEANSDGAYRFKYHEFVDSRLVSENKWDCYDAEIIVWDNKQNKDLYDQADDELELDENGYCYFPLGYTLAEIGNREIDLNFYYSVVGYQTAVTVVNNVDNQTATIFCNYIYEGDQIKTRIPARYFDLFYSEYDDSFYKLFDIAGYTFSGKSNYTKESNGNYYSCVSSKAGVTLVLEYEPVYAMFYYSINGVQESRTIKQALTDGENGFAYSITFDTPITMTAAKWEEVKQAINAKDLVRDELFTNEEYATISAAFNSMFGLDGKYRVDGFSSGLKVALVYHDRNLKDRSISWDGIRFELNDSISPKIMVFFTDEEVKERPSYTGESVDNWINNVIDSIKGDGEDGWLTKLKTFGLVCLGILGFVILVKILTVIVRFIKVLFGGKR
jgi:hypothetical protein